MHAFNARARIAALAVYHATVHSAFLRRHIKPVDAFSKQSSGAAEEHGDSSSVELRHGTRCLFCAISSLHKTTRVMRLAREKGGIAARMP